jgi:hypothetical protein
MNWGDLNKRDKKETSLNFEDEQLDDIIFFCDK